MSSNFENNSNDETTKNSFVLPSADMPPIALDGRTMLDRQHPNDAAELKSDIAWFELLGGVEDPEPRIYELLARPISVERFTPSQIAAYILTRLRLF